MCEESAKLDVELEGEEGVAFAIACEEVIEAVKSGEIEGEYFEF